MKHYSAIKMTKSIFNNMSGHWMHCAKWNKSDGEKSSLYDLIFGIWKQDKNKLIGKKSQTVVSRGWGCIGGNWKKVVKRYKHPVKRQIRCTQPEMCAQHDSN